jgi:tRNA G18 (ribose-2'-O)-methylase SpoU
MTLTPITHLDAISVPYNYDPEAPVGSSANVVDKYRNYVVEAVRLDLDTRRSPLINVCVNTGSDFNLSSVIRNGNAMAVRATIVVGRRKWDTRGAVGTNHYEHVLHSPDILDVIEALRADDYTCLPVDNTAEFHPTSIFDTKFDEKTAFFYGEEGDGLSLDVVEACDNPPVYLPQGGSTRSINIACASAVFTYEYVRQWPQEWQE